MSGFGVLFGLTLRRNWLFYLLWVVVLASLPPVVVNQYQSLFPDPATAAGELLLLANDPTMRAILGTPFDLTTAYGFAAWRVGNFVSYAAGMVAALGVIRSTRAEEELGRIELIRSGAVARQVPLLAAIAVSSLANGVLAALVILGLLGVGAPLAGSLTLGLAIGLGGAMFTGIGAVTAQLFQSARTARYWSFGIVLGGLYLLRAIVDANSIGGEVSAGWQVLTWLNPLSWVAEVRSFAGERWWVLLLPLTLSVALCWLALGLNARRDLGAAIWATRSGRATAPGYLSGAFGLAWRLQRGAVIGWLVGISVGALGIGSLAARISDFIAGNQGFAQILQRLGYGATDLTQAFEVAMIGLLVMLLSLGSLAILGRLRAEEVAGHAEVMLATATSRTKFAASHLVLSLATTGLLSVLTGVGIALPAITNSEVSSDIATMAVAGLALFPGTLLLLGVAMFLLGWFPAGYPLVWALLGWSIFASWFGSLFALPEWVIKLQPWGQLPHLPADELSWGWISLETSIGLLLLLVGLLGYQRRDIPS